MLLLSPRFLLQKADILTLIFLSFFREQSQYFFNTTSAWKFRFGEKIFQIRNILPDKSQFSHRWEGVIFFTPHPTPSTHAHTHTHTHTKTPPALVPTVWSLKTTTKKQKNRRYTPETRDRYMEGIRRIPQCTFHYIPVCFYSETEYWVSNMLRAEERQTERRFYRKIIWIQKNNFIKLL